MGVMASFLLDAGTHCHAIHLAPASQRATASLWLARKVLQNPSYDVWFSSPEIEDSIEAINADAQLRAFFYEDSQNEV